MSESATTQPVDIVQLLENAPLTRLSDSCQHRLMTKMRETFTDKEQQMFLMSFYTYLNYDKHEFVVDLDKVWEWLGFSNKDKAKRLLEKSFSKNVDYNCSLTQSGERKVGRGGQNKETIRLTIKAFKSFCLKAGTKKADQIHEYYIKLEEMLQEVVYEESAELRKRLEHSTETTQKIRQSILLQNFPDNTQCVYYGSISNKSTDGKSLIKFGNSNNLSERIAVHKKTYADFQLLQAFRVDNKLQIENAIKKHPILSKHRRSIEIEGKNYTELLAIDVLPLEEIDKIIQGIIKSLEFTPENYTKLLEENEKLRQMYNEKANTMKSIVEGFHTSMNNALIKNNRFFMASTLLNYNDRLKIQTQHMNLLRKTVNECQLDPSLITMVDENELIEFINTKHPIVVNFANQFSNNALI
jgi:phage anti-repressor protein